MAQADIESVPIKTVRAEDALLFRNDLVRARITHREPKAVYIISHASQPPAPVFKLGPLKSAGTRNGDAPQISQDTLVPADAYDLVEVVVGDTDVVAPDALGYVQVSCVRRGQVRFCVLRTEEVYGMDVAVLLRQVREVALEGRLRCLRARDLYPLAKCLQPLLLPKH
jgi:hypothetical protein